MSDRQNCSSCPTQNVRAKVVGCLQVQIKEPELVIQHGSPQVKYPGFDIYWILKLSNGELIYNPSNIPVVGPVGTHQGLLVKETLLHLLRDDPKTPTETHLQLNLIQLCGTGLIIGKVWGETRNVMQFY